MEPECPSCGSNDIVRKQVETSYVYNRLAFVEHDGRAVEVDRGGEEVEREVMDTEHLDDIRCNDCGHVEYDAEEFIPGGEDEEE